ncbi:hypothetical protein BGZ60DRAFT_421888 [Tricladium varicosporioides]|nr:hypothetical protein BGZ60DRAFT_421888 [Hymenoscyphus varicosporioides]
MERQLEREDAPSTLETPGKRLGGHSAWTSMWQRAAHDIDVLGRAARTDRDGEIDRLGDLMTQHSLVDVGWIDYEGIWDRISELMKKYGTEFKWTPERVEYAWTHGVSDIFPDVVLRQRQFGYTFLPNLDPYSWLLDSPGQSQ